jgi:D-tyrosyl-tRNA(Tyr) deacylase|tara:strand:- start:527 stop:973 length:447 start_codon:yes stop_codon:yes gene_type:complete
MLGLIQRVSSASVAIDNQVNGKIDQGLVLLLGIQKDDDQSKADQLLKKVVSYRIFADAAGKMNLSLNDVGGGLLVISQFTLAADTSKGLRPGFSTAAPPEQAKVLYDYFLAQAQANYAPDVNIESGIFGANMQVSLCNDGPVTFVLRS